MIKPHLTFLFIRPLRALLRFLELSTVTWGLVIGMYIPIAGQVRIDLSIKPDSLTVGDKFLYINKVEIPEGFHIKPLPPGDQLGEASVLSEIIPLVGQDSDAAAYACTLAVYKTGAYAIPSLTFALTDSLGEVREISGDSLPVRVNSVLPADSVAAAASDIADIRDPYRLPAPIWPYILLPLGILLVGYASHILYNRFRKIPEIPREPPSPPWEIAFAKLDALKKNRHYEFGRIKQFYFELSLIAREYIERRYGFPAVESTTFELERESRLEEIETNLYGRLFEFFNRADIAKFAKGTPSRDDADCDLAFAYEFVRRTIPLAGEPAERAARMVEVES